MNIRMQTDAWISRTVLVLGLILVLSVAGILILMITDHLLPEVLVALGSAAIGGLAGLLAPSLLNR